jgi:hypothetical protein
METSSSSPKKDFGKRIIAAPAPGPAQRKTRVPSVMLKSALALATFVGAVWAYNNQDLLAARFYPAALGGMTLYKDSRRVAPVWDVAGPYQEVMPTIHWMTVGFRRICGNIGYPTYTTSDPDYLAADPGAPNRYRPDVYGTKRTAREVVAEVAKTASTFCGRDYHLAMYDARVGTWPAFQARMDDQRAQNEVAVAKFRARSQELTQEFARSPRHSATEPDMDINGACAVEWESNYTMQEYCRKQHEEARAWAHNHSIDTDIAIHCTKEWPNNWRMFAYCAKQQEEAKARL